jgi:RimJ/RimL family protein N-acetyltransferase
MNTLPGSRCTLEPQVEAHAPEMFVVLSDPAIYEFEGVPPPSIERLAAGFKRRESRVSPDGTEQWLNWVVRLPTADLAGYVQATIYPSGSAYIGYEFSSKYWRRGIGTAALTLMLEELSAHYAVHTFVAVLKSANYRSIGLLHKLGFAPGTQEDAVLYEAESDETTLTMPAAKLGPATTGTNAAVYLPRDRS